MGVPRRDPGLPETVAYGLGLTEMHADLMCCSTRWPSSILSLSSLHHVIETSHYAAGGVERSRRFADLAARGWAMVGRQWPLFCSVRRYWTDLLSPYVGSWDHISSPSNVQGDNRVSKARPSPYRFRSILHSSPQAHLFSSLYLLFSGLF